MNTFTLEIERIILTDAGASPNQADRLRALIEEEVALRFSRGGWPDRSVAVQRCVLESTSMATAGQSQPRKLAAQVAQELMRTIESLR